MPHAREMRVIPVPVHVAADAHDEQRHLLVAVEEVSVGAVAEGLRADGARVDGAHRVLEDPVAFLEAALVRAEHALVFAGKGVADTVLEQRARPDDDGRLAEVFQHGQELLLDHRHELARQQPLAQRRGEAQIVLRLDHPGTQVPDAALHGVGIEHVRADEIGVVRLDAPLVEIRVGVADHVTRQQHADGLAADASRADLALFDLHEVAQGEIGPAQLQHVRLRAEQAFHDVLLERHALRVFRLRALRADRVEHAVPAVASLAGLREDIEDGVGVAA